MPRRRPGTGREDRRQRLCARPPCARALAEDRSPRGTREARACLTVRRRRRAGFRHSAQRRQDSAWRAGARSGASLCPRPRSPRAPRPVGHCGCAGPAPALQESEVDALLVPCDSNLPVGRLVHDSAADRIIAKLATRPEQVCTCPCYRRHERSSAQPMVSPVTE